MKKIIPALVIASYLIFPALAAAAEIKEAPTIAETPQGFLDKINLIGNWIFTILLAVAGIFLMVAGFFFITAQGDPQKITTARQMLINALIGVGVALSARGMVAVIDSVLRGS